MTSSAFWPYGTTIKIGDDGTSETFTAIAEVKDITPPQMSKDSIEVTSQDSTSGFREFIPGWKDAGEVSFEANWLPNAATHDGTTGLLASFNDDLNHNWLIVLPTAVSITLAFTGHVTNFEPDLPMEDGAGLSATIKLTGVITIYSIENRRMIICHCQETKF